MSQLVFKYIYLYLLVMPSYAIVLFIHIIIKNIFHFHGFKWLFI